MSVWCRVIVGEGVELGILSDYYRTGILIYSIMDIGNFCYTYNHVAPYEWGHWGLTPERAGWVHIGEFN